MNASPKGTLGISVGLAHEFCLTAQKVGFTPEEIHTLAANEETLSKIRDVVLGRAEIRTRQRGTDWPLWKTISLGTCRSGEEYAESLRSTHCVVKEWALLGLSHASFDCSAEARYVDVAIVSVADLGFKEMERRDMIYQRAFDRGLRAAPAELGPAIRLAFRKQPSKDSFLIGMEPIASGRGPILFSVDHDGKNLCLDGHVGDGDTRWPLPTRFAFVVPPRKKPGE